MSKSLNTTRMVIKQHLKIEQSLLSNRQCAYVIFDLDWISDCIQNSLLLQFAGLSVKYISVLQKSFS